MRIDRLERAAVREAGMKVSSDSRKKFRKGIDTLRALGVLETTSGDRVRLTRKIFARNDGYLDALVEAAREVMSEAGGPLSSSTFVRRVNRKLVEFGDVRRVPGLIIKLMARQPQRSGFRSDSGLYMASRRGGGRSKVLATNKLHGSHSRRDCDGAADRTSVESVPSRERRRGVDSFLDAVSDTAAVREQEGDRAEDDDYLADLLGIEDDEHLNQRDGGRSLEQELGFDHPGSTPNAPSPSQVTSSLDELAAFMNGLWVRAESAGGQIRAEVTCKDQRSQLVFLAPKLFGAANVPVLEVASPVAERHMAGQLDIALVCGRTCFGSPEFRAYQGKEFLFIVARLAWGCVTKEGVQAVCVTVGQDADELDLLLAGEVDD